MTSYRKGRLLGKGGFAKCYELTDLKSNKTYAGKIIAKSRLVKGNQKEKILREVELHRNLRHPNVVCFHSYFEDECSVYMVLENCSRKSLVHILKNRLTLTDPEVRFYMHHLVAGLRYIHGQRIVHRDLKLGNMLLNGAMQLKIADFGLATRIEYEGEKKMTVCGTPNYIAPEVLQKRGHSYEADIWALGCIMYALLCGRPPFETATLKETYTRIVTNKFTMPPHVLMSARNLICQLLTLEPSSRPSLDRIDADNYFVDGHMPVKLDPSTCETPPKFPVSTIIPTKPRPAASSALNNKDNNASVAQSPLAQTKGSRKSASQIITRTQTPDIETPGSLLREGYPHQAGSAPSMQPDSPIDLSGLPVWSAVRLYRLLLTCLETDIVSNSVVTEVNRPRIMCITKWVDYSNKYGFGFQLSDHSVGILFNDNTRMMLTSDGSTVQYNDLSNRTHSFSAQSPMTEHQKKVTLLLYFAEYMDTHLIPGGNVHLLTSGYDRPAPIFMKKWFRTDRAIVMYLSNGTLQVNFLDDHTKIIISPDSNQDYLVTYVNSGRQAVSFLLTAIRHFGCTSDVIESLRYACRMLECIINVDGESV
jgi:serine/threonine protein kinase